MNERASSAPLDQIGIRVCQKTMLYDIDIMNGNFYSRIQLPTSDCIEADIWTN